MTRTWHLADAQGGESGLALGTRRACAALLLMLALPGGGRLVAGAVTTEFPQTGFSAAARESGGRSGT